MRYLILVCPRQPTEPAQWLKWRLKNWCLATFSFLLFFLQKWKANHSLIVADTAICRKVEQIARTACIHFFVAAITVKYTVEQVIFKWILLSKNEYSTNILFLRAYIAQGLRESQRYLLHHDWVRGQERERPGKLRRRVHKTFFNFFSAASTDGFPTNWTATILRKMKLHDFAIFLVEKSYNRRKLNV